MNREEIIKLLKILQANYPHAKITDAKATATAWEMQLSDYSAESVYKAARLHMSSSPYFPTPSNILSNIVRAELIYRPEPVQRLEAPKKDDLTEQYLDAFCEWIGLGCEENDKANLLPGFLPYEQ